MITALNGMKVFVSPLHTRVVARHEPRTARERWLSWPWRPWVRTKTIAYAEPADPLVIGGHTVIVHPVHERKLRLAASPADGWSEQGVGR